jgi:predicted permease
MLDAVGRLPGVEASAAVSGEVLFSGIRGRASVAIPGRGDLPDEDAEVGARSVTPTYHRLLGIPLVRGRYLTDADRAGAASVVLVNQTAARKYWPGQEALGQRLVVNRRESVVVGIVADVRHWNLEGPVEPECYLPLLQGSAAGQMILVRTARNPRTLLPAIRKAIWSVNNDVPIIGDQAAAEDRLDRLLAQRRFSMALLVLFGVLGLAISAVGIYGVLAYLVAQRTSEIGVRMALGATPGGVVAMVLRRAGALIGVGLALGAGVAWYFSAVAKSFLFQIEPTDPRVFAAALAVLAVAGLAASVVPARRAASVDPIVALRQE